MLNDYKSTAQNRAAPKVEIIVIGRLLNSLTFMYDAQFTIWWNYHFTTDYILYNWVCDK